MPTEKPPTYEPNTAALTQRLRAEEPMSREEFMKLVSPKTFEGLTHADTADKFLDTFGIATERINRLKEAKHTEDALTPAYHAYIQDHLKHLTDGSTYGQAKTLYPDVPWEKGNQPNSLTPGNTPQISSQAGVPPTAGGMLPPGTTAPGSVLPSQQSPMQGPTYGPPSPSALPGTALGGSYNMGPNESGWENPQPIQDFNTPQVTLGQGPMGQPMAQPGLLPQAPQSSVGQSMGPVGNENDLLPRPYQKYVDMKQHQTGLRGFNPDRRGAGGGSAQSQILNHYQGLATGEIPEAYEGEKGFYEKLLTESKHAGVGTLEGQNKQLDIDRKKELLPTVGAQANATLEDTKARTKGAEARTETENTLRDARLRNIEASIALKQKQEELAGSQRGSELMKQKSIMFNAMKYGIAQGIFDENDERSILNYIAPDTMGFTGTPPGKFKQFLFDTFGLGTGEDTGIHVAPKGTATPAQGKSDFSDAPPGKKQGQVLNQNGKPVATWSGKAWVPISTK